MFEQLSDAIINIREDEALEITRSLIEKGQSPLAILDKCTEAVEEVGKRFEAGTYYLPELLMSGEMLKSISEMVKPHIKQGSVARKKGKVLIGTVQGDLHDIGKNIVSLGQVSCIAGNVPLDILCTGSTTEVKAYCKNLIAAAGKNGGFILSSGAGVQGARPENVRAMIDYSKKNGEY